MALTALIFDLDGTLIDSNHAHVQAWLASLKKHGYTVSPDRVALEIGKGGDKLVPSILGQLIDDKDGDSLRKGHAAEYAKIANATHIPPFPGVELLFAAVRQRGLKLALATSSKQSELALTLNSARVDWLGHFDQIATGDDASDSKPAPAILQVAIEKLKISPAQCAMIGDTPYDADTARDAGAISLGVTCGHMNDARTLRATGMRKVYADPLDMHAHLDELLHIVSPGKAILTYDAIESLMRKALAVAREGLDKGEAPIGCVIARGDGHVIARGHNELNLSQTKIAHAEMIAFGRTAGLVPTDARDLIMASTLEPCVMCVGAAMEAAVDTILFGLPAPLDGGRTRVRPPLSPESQMPRILGNVLAHQSRKLLVEFCSRAKSNPQQVRCVQQMLSPTAT